MAENEQERTEEATSRRREEAREKGQVARSQEIISVGILVACLIYFYPLTVYWDESRGYNFSFTKTVNTTGAGRSRKPK